MTLATDFLKMLAVLAALVCTGQCALGQASQGITPCVLTFTPAPPVTQSVTTSSSRVQFSTCAPTVVVYNTTSQEVFYNVGTSSSLAATTAGWSLPGNTYVVLNVGSSGLYFAAITASGTSTLRFVQGRSQ